MLWHLLKFYFIIVIKVFFKRIRVSHAHYLNVKEPVILAMNHPNALMDPVAFTASICGPKLRYLARGDAFKKGLITWLLQWLGIIPIFRIQDGGKEGLLKNNETYQIVNSLLKKNKKIIIFAEGICVQERRLRPLKKGVPRMIFGAMNELNLKNLTVLPIGVNYQNPSQFRGTVFFNIGEPMQMIDYIERYKDAPSKTMNVFLADLQAKMKELIVHINHEKSETLIEYLEVMLKHDYFKKQHLDLKNLEHEFLFSKQIVKVINNAEESQPEQLETLSEKVNQYASELKKHQLRDWLIDSDYQKNINYLASVLRLSLIVVSLPIYICGLIGNYWPYKLSYIITSNKVKHKEFKATFYMGIGALLFLINYLFLFFISSALYSSYWGLLVIVISLLSGYACLFLSPLRKKTMGMLRILKLKSKNKTTYNHLIHQRQQAIDAYHSLTHGMA
ncbi:MAG: 1-acyl-sn-glycerol-3-phosphate acyltransferase [Bacteroidota bacterium]|jgi:1-acyl-sn-glycerol-3-phosphate acyltransferase